MIRWLWPLLVFTGAASADPLILQSTTSTQNSGLYDAILPAFTRETGIAVSVVAVGTGQALKNARNCDADLLLTHAREAEEAFVAAGYGLSRTDLMFNNFVLVGPGGDPAEIATANNAIGALNRIARSGLPFASRGDDSGTHRAELALWDAAGLPVVGVAGPHYLETGAGMGATLNVAVGLGAYTLSDRATWLAFGNKGDHRILFAGDPLLFNQYGLVLLDPAHCPRADHAGARALHDWLLGPDGQAAIGAFTIEDERVFTPNAP